MSTRVCFEWTEPQRARGWRAGHLRLDDAGLDRIRLPEISLTFHQSNHEGVLVDRVQQARDEADGLIVNPAADTLTSIALPDALKTSCARVSARSRWSRAAPTRPCARGISPAMPSIWSRGVAARSAVVRGLLPDRSHHAGCGARARSTGALGWLLRPQAPALASRTEPAQGRPRTCPIRGISAQTSQVRT
jgi:hypothetical protein